MEQGGTPYLTHVSNTEQRENDIMSRQNRGMNAFKKSRKKHEEAAPVQLRDPWDMQNFQIAVGSAALVRVLEPDTEDGAFYLRKLHWVRGPKTCTSDLPGFEGKCVYCHYYDKAKKGDKDRENLYPRVQQVAEVIDFRYFHKVKTTVDGSDKLLQQECGSTDASPKRSKCKYCKQAAGGDQNVSERYFGGHKIWELGKQHFGQLMDVNERLAATCVHGHYALLDEEGNPLEEQPESICGEDVEVLGYGCEECGHEYISERDLETIEEDELYRCIDNEQVCPVDSCGHESFPMPIAMCSSGEHEPVFGTVFDKVVEVSRTGTKSDNNKKSSAYNFDRSQPWSHLEDDLKPHVGGKDDLEEMIKPWDLFKRFRPEYIDAEKYKDDGEAAYIDAVLKSQAERIKRPNPYEGSGGKAGGRSRPFGRRRR